MAQKDLCVKSPLWLLVLPVWMSDWKWIAPVSVHRQHICGLICLLLKKSEPRAVSSQWPHSRQNSGTVVLHVTVYNPPAHLHPRKQPSNLCDSSISACLKGPFQAERWSFRSNMTSSELWHIFIGKPIKPKGGAWAVCVEPHRMRPKWAHQPKRLFFYSSGLLLQNKSESLRATNRRVETKMVTKVPEHQDEWDNLVEKGRGGGA